MKDSTFSRARLAKKYIARYSQETDTIQSMITKCECCTKKTRPLKAQTYTPTEAERVTMGLPDHQDYLFLYALCNDCLEREDVYSVSGANLIKDWQGKYKMSIPL